MLEQRLTELRAELEKGNQELDRLEQRRQTLRDQMLRISGAVQVLEELLAAQATDAEGPRAAAG